LYNKTPSDTQLVIKGKFSYEWAYKNMLILDKIGTKHERSSPLAGYKVAFCLHITKETSVLAKTVKRLGAEIAICSANPLSVQEDIAAFLSSEGINTFAWREETIEEYRGCIRQVLKFRPHILTDDGAELHVAAHRNKTRNILGGTEETTSGVRRLKSLESRKQLQYPIISVNEAYTKYMFDNRYGTGQSTIDGILRTTGIFMPGKHVVVCGYGWVGKGVSSRARGMGALVTVTEVDPIKALEAHMEGYSVKRLSDVADNGDIFLTCTGQKHVIREEHMTKMKNGAILANAGHFDVEIDTRYLYSQGRRPVEVRPNVEQISLPGRKIYLISKGRVINLTGAEGHPPQIMALSFANQLLSIIFISKNYRKMKKKTYPVPKRIDLSVADYAIQALDLRIDSLTNEQLSYNEEWDQ
jgi:adenosylhomocysteinase